jgi:hypothetical protein
MRKWVGEHPWLAGTIAAGLVFAALFFGSLLIPAVGDICTYPERIQKLECSQHHLGPFVGLWIILLIDNHNGFVTAIATIIMAAFTGTLWLTSRRQGDLAQQSIDLARAEFIAAHRPEPVIREVFWSLLTDSHSDVVAFTLINRGRGQCRIVESALEVRSDNPITQFKTDGINSLGDIGLAPGEFCFRQIVVDPFIAGGRGLFEEIFLRGLIVYEDDAKVRRRAVFCRRAAKGEDRFFPLGDPEHEYTD